MILRLSILALLGFFALLPAAFAADPELPAPLQRQRDAGAQIYYLGQFETLNGWVLIRQGKPEFYYATPDNKAIMLGLLFNGEGAMQTMAQMTALQATKKEDILNMVDPVQGTMSAPAGAPAEVALAAQAETPTPTPSPATTEAQAALMDPGALISPEAAAVPATQPTPPATPANSPSENLMSSMQNAPGITWGAPGAATFYVFLDPDCTHCQRFLREVEPFVTTGRVAVRMTLVGFNDDSMRKAAYLIAASDGADRMVRQAKGDANALSEVGNPDTTAIKANVSLMHSWNLNGTPIILYRGASDQKIRLVRGRPLDVPATVNDLAPIP